MRKINLTKVNLKATGSELSKGLKNLATGGFQQLYKHIDKQTVKQGVDRLGIDKFINQCALLAAGSGAISGLGGAVTLLVGVPLDTINLITQQFRVTLAINYYKTGTYKLRFQDFFRIVASSLKVDAGMAISKNVMEQVVEKLMLSIGAKTAERLIPVVGAVIGGTANYLFIKKIANNLLEKKAVK